MNELMFTYTCIFLEQSLYHETTLSTHISQPKNENKNFDLRWSLICKAKAFNPTKVHTVTSGQIRTFGMKLPPGFISHYPLGSISNHPMV